MNRRSHRDDKWDLPSSPAHMMWYISEGVYRVTAPSYHDLCCQQGLDLHDVNRFWCGSNAPWWMWNRDECDRSHRTCPVYKRPLEMLFSQGRKDGVNAGVWGNANAGIKMVRMRSSKLTCKSKEGRNAGDFFPRKIISLVCYKVYCY